MHYESENCVTTERWTALGDTNIELTMREREALKGQSTDLGTRRKSAKNIGLNRSKRS